MKRPIYATDVMLFSMINAKLKVLLIKRENSERQGGKWALPGGVVDYSLGETSLIKAIKVLDNRLGIKEDLFLERCDIYDDIKRDPDEYSVSVSYLSLIDENKTNLVKGDGVSEIKWTDVNKLPELAFDHKDMIKDGLKKIRNSLRRSNLGFKFLPKEFTIPQIRKIYEDILGIEINPSNFRTKLLKMDVLNPCNKKQRVDYSDKVLKGQPPQLYTLKEDSLKKVLSTEQLFNK